MRNVSSLALTVVAFAAVIAGSADDAFGCRLTLGDRVWADSNRNGVQDPGEPGINGVRITIDPPFYLNGDPATDILVSSTTTATSVAGDGYYAFVNVDCGVDYTIAVDASTVPAGLAPADIGIGSDRALDSNNHAGSVVNVPVSDFPPNDLTIDFGYVAPACAAAIGNRVWSDTNNNGIQDGGEGNWAGAVVTLSPGGSVATDQNGLYSFGGLCAGTYQVCVATPPDSNPSPANQGGDDELDSDGVAGANGVCTTVTLSNNTVDNSNDFGFHVPLTPSAGTGTPGYWQNHPEAWPVDSIVIGGRTYAKSIAIEMMPAGQSSDKSYTMFMHLVSTKLNLLLGTEASCIAGIVGLADEWLTTYPVGSMIRGSSLAWKNGEPLAVELDRYNNGMLCAPARD
jgi:hypothetical protein